MMLIVLPYVNRLSLVKSNATKVIVSNVVLNTDVVHIS